MCFEYCFNSLEFLQLLMTGIQCHIGSSDQKVRIIGMVLAEMMSAILDPKGQQLKFEVHFTVTYHFLK